MTPSLPCDTCRVPVNPWTCAIIKTQPLCEGCAKELKESEVLNGE